MRAQGMACIEIQNAAKAEGEKRNVSGRKSCVLCGIVFTHAFKHKVSTWMDTQIARASAVQHWFYNYYAFLWDLFSILLCGMLCMNLCVCGIVGGFDDDIVDWLVGW